MKKFNFKGVLDGLRSSVSAPPKTETEIKETLRSDHFQLMKTIRHGFPYQPTAMAHDPVQHILAIGTKNGSLRIFGRPGVDCHVRHDNEIAVIQLLFLINEGALISVCSDDTLHLWNLRQKRPEIVHSLKFQRERITYCHLPFQSKWLYIGTERGNIHIVNIESFVLSGYVINWNKTIELSRKTHPGPVMHLNDNPIDPNKLLIGYESGTVVLWDLKTKSAEFRYQCSEAIKSVAWHHEGKQFLCSQTDGSLVMWTVKNFTKPATVFYPHAKINKDGKPDPCKPINKVEWKTVKGGDSYIIFSGGVTYDKAGRTPSITVVHGKTTTVLEMEHNVVDFITLCVTPWESECQDPYAIVVLLQNDLVVVDLTSPGYPCFENPYPMDIHESPVTCCSYYADCPTDLIPAFYSVLAKQKRLGFSEKSWPICGGEWGTAICSYPEIIITGHADGSVKFWDASAVTLQVLYKLKTMKIFEKPKHKSLDGQDEDPFAIHHLFLCPESRLLCLAGASGHVMLFKFSKQENISEVTYLETSIIYEPFEELESPKCEYPPHPSLGTSTHQSGSFGSHSSGASDEGKKLSCGEVYLPLKVKSGSHKHPPGYQVDLVCLTPWTENDIPGQITALTLNSSYGLMAYGTELGLVVVDIVQKICLLSMATPDLYGSADPYQRVPRSPKRQGNDGNSDQDRCRSPTVDQNNSLPPPHTLPFPPPQSHSSRGSCKERINGVCLSPTAKHQKKHPPDLKQNKPDSSFSRSRSSSISSLENVSSEAIQCLYFVDSYTRKADSLTCPCLWVGTSLGSILVIILNLPPPGDLRSTQPVIVSPSGTIFTMKGAIMAMSFLDCNGALIHYLFESWKDANKESKDKEKADSPALPKQRISPTSAEVIDRQFAVVCSEQQARVITLPSQTCVYKIKISDNAFVIKADIVSVKDSVCLTCYLSNGHIMVFSLPSLKCLMDVEYLPPTEVRISRTFCFSNNGHALYLCSPTEIQKITFSAEICENLQEMLGDLFLPCETPEPPKQGFFKGLFGGGTHSLDREQLFGESSGKASRSLAKHIPGTAGLEHLKGQATGVAADVQRTRMALVERGERLGELEERTGQMMMQAESFSQAANQIMQKYRDKKWYQF